MSETDKEFAGLISNLLVNAKGFCDYGINHGLITAEDVRLTIAKRQEKAKALVDSGMSQRQAAKALGVGRGTVQRDLDRNGPESGPKRATQKKPKPRHVIDTPSDPIVEPCTDCDTQEEEWQRSLSNMAGDAISLPAFWSRQFSEDWSKFKVTGEMLTLAEDAAATWSKLAIDLKRRKEKGK